MGNDFVEKCWVKNIIFFDIFISLIFAPLITQIWINLFYRFFIMSTRFHPHFYSPTIPPSELSSLPLHSLSSAALSELPLSLPHVCLSSRPCLLGFSYDLRQSLAAYQSRPKTKMKQKEEETRTTFNYSVPKSRSCWSENRTWEIGNKSRFTVNLSW